MTRREKNRVQARIYFGVYGDRNYILHHKDTELKEKDPDRYYQYNPEDLVLVTKAEHNRIHFCGTMHSEETIRKIAESKIGRHIEVIDGNRRYVK